MAIDTNKLPETYSVYRLKSTSVPNSMGEMPAYNAADTTNYEDVGTIKARVNTGDSLEPDVLGTSKDYGPDGSSMWLAWFAIPSGFDIESGDIIVNDSDSDRVFQIQYLDKYPGGVSGHHYEARLQTTEVFRHG